MSSLNPLARNPRPRPLPLPPAMERALYERWQRWLPFAALEALRLGKTRGPMEPTTISFWQERFRVRVLTCFRHRLDWRVIKRNNLDDPRLDDAQFQAALDAALGRSAGHRGQNYRKQPRKQSRV